MDDSDSSDDSDTSDTSDISSSYSSDGEVLTSYAKTYDSSSEEEVDSETMELSPVPDGHICQEEVKEVMTVMTSSPSVRYFQLIPNDVNEYLVHLYPHIISRLKILPRRGCSVAVASRSLLNMVDDSQVVPVSVLCDVCVFSPTEPVTVLTFTGAIGKVSKAVKYNSQLTRVMNQSVKSNTRYCFNAVYGVVPEKMCHTNESFLLKFIQLEKDAKVMSLPQTLDMTPAKCKAVLKSFLKLIPSVHGPDSPTVITLDEDR